ncbi:MAG TPA: type VI secretion system tube protein Hcp [Myxococcota bacterium]|nr:type VI secretion system tube protein Hcp [Myxococcota bacterium]
MNARRIIALTGLLLAVVLCGTARFARAGYTSYLKLDGVTGESQPPGLPDATLVRSLSLGSHTFSETQIIDSTSSSLQQALLQGTSTDGEIAFFKQPITTSEPYEKILLHDIIVSSIQTGTFNSQPSENVSFQFASPATYLYLALPGTGGSGSPPGRPGVIPIDSLTITDNVFSVHRAVDATSPALAAAFANGSAFANASLLVYTDITAQTQPDFSIVFDQALISSIVGDDSGPVPGETISFSATDANVVPEPGSAALLAAGVLVAAVRRRSRPS